MCIESMKIGIWGYYGFDNLGDDLILDTLLSWIRDIDNTAEVSVFIKKEERDQILEKNNIQGQKARTIKTALKFALEEADLFIIGGGGIFPSWTSSRLMFYSLIALIMKIRKKKCICLGVGVEEKNLLRKSNRFWLEFLTRMVNRFTVRELQLRENEKIKPIKSEKNIQPTADIVFSRSVNKLQQENKRFNIFLADIFDIFPDLDKETFQEEMMEVIRKIINMGYDVYMIPFTNTKDQKFNDEICEKVNSVRCHSIKYSKDLNEMTEEIAKGHFSLCMRFHAIVLSVIYEIPMCSISYGDKSSKLMDRINMKKYNMDFGDNNGLQKNYINLNAQDIMEKIHMMLENEKSIHANLTEQCQKLKKESLENYLILKEYME